ncbi:MAG: hypothetical protein A3D92_23430 [Bacteroidetes bacterium RIFCSPHIGHO2_02_FULL_44_7]|nr:MAG: hypothetical protein A3D92_23430 [Bacteroidetes bacterium RIFCSPHIGHO2_02_FULL_44_7]
MASSQKDFGLWSGVDVRVPMTKKLSAGIEIQARFKDNISRVDNSFLSPYLKYDVHRHLGIGVDYRFTNEAGPSGFFGTTNLHRICLDIEANKLVDLIADDSRFDASVRVRYTHENTLGDQNNDYLRMQVNVKYKLSKSKLEPEVAAELFYRFNDQLSYSFSEVRSRSRFNKYRVRVGLNYDLNKQNSVKIFYMVQSGIESPKADFILGVGYTYRFKKLFKK